MVYSKYLLNKQITKPSRKPVLPLYKPKMGNRLWAKQVSLGQNGYESLYLR